MDRVAKSSLNKARPPLFKEMPARIDLVQYFDVVKQNDTIYFVGVEDFDGKGMFFTGGDCVVRFFLTVREADTYRNFCQDQVPQMKFFIVKFEAIDGIAKAISDVKTSSKPSSLAVAAYRNELLVDIDVVYSTKQLLN